MITHISRILFAAAIIALPLGATGQPKLDRTCTLKSGSAENCVPVVGCLGGTGVYFTGRAFGWGSGGIAIETSHQLTCHGTWTSRGPMGFGQAEFACDDGRTGAGLYTSQDGATGTATGFGKLSDGKHLRVWSGHNIDQFMTNQNGDVNTGLECLACLFRSVKSA